MNEPNFFEVAIHWNARTLLSDAQDMAKRTLGAEVPAAPDACINVQMQMAPGNNARTLLVHALAESWAKSTPAPPRGLEPRDDAVLQAILYTVEQELRAALPRARHLIATGRL